MSILVSTTEPQKLQELGTASWAPEKVGCDFLVLSGKKRIGVQRKKFPDDFLSSYADGRIGEQIGRMQKLRQALFIIEGHGRWSTEGELIGSSHFQNLTIQQLFGMFYTLMFLHGRPVLWVRDMKETGQALAELDAWVRKEKHESTIRRPKPTKSSWGQVSNEQWASHLLQSFPGVGPGTAENIVKHFGYVPLTWTVAVEEMEEVPGIGTATAKKLMGALEA